MRKLFFSVILLLINTSVFALMNSPVTVDITRQEDDDKPYLELSVELNIPDGIHVYATKDMFLDLVVDKSENLAKPELILPPTKPYKNFDGSMLDVFSGSSRLIARFNYNDQPGALYAVSGYFQYQGCSDSICYPPKKVPFSFEGTVPASVQSTGVANEASTPYASLLWGILGAFFAGVLLSLTPCVYPMIGVTIAVIGAKQASRGQTFFLTFLYILGLSLVYSIVGVIVATIGSTAASFFRSVWVLVPIGILFIILGLSMFDLIVIQTSSSLAAKVQKFSGKSKGSYIGTFLLGAVSAFVVGPCVSGPLISLITFVATSGDIVRGFAFFFALAWGMGMILFVAGTLSGALPKAGVWMGRIKHTIGVVLIWAGFYFTRPFIGEAVFISVSIAAFALGLHTIGILSIPDSGATPKKIFLSLLGAVVCAVFAYTQIVSLQGTALNANISQKIDLDVIVNTTTKPIILDFNAPWCTICKEIEHTVLQKQNVQKRLQDFVFVSVDYDNNPHLVEQFNIIGPPAFVFLDRQGKQVGKIIVTGEELEQRLFAD